MLSFASGAPPAHAQTAADKRELDARTSFARGDYQEALSLYVKLYAETLHPTYLRNIGRCYQNLRQPDKAIDSFREYLRKAKDLPPEKRAEIDGFIAEMEALKRQQQQAAAKPPASGVAPPPHAAAPPSDPGPSSSALPPSLSATAGDPAGTPAGADLAAQPAAPRPLHQQWWFWAGVGTLAVIVVAVVAVAASGGGPPHGNAGTWDLRPTRTP